MMNDLALFFSIILISIGINGIFLLKYLEKRECLIIPILFAYQKFIFSLLLSAVLFS